MIEKNILILNSKITTFNFENGDRTYNVVTFAFRDDLADKEMIGLNEILKCSLNPTSYDVTKAIEPNKYVKATLSLKRAENNTFKYIITKLNDIEVC